MITSPASHDYTLVNQLSSVVSTQPVVANTNGSSFTSKICNIPCYSYKGTKIAVQYTHEKITTHPMIVASILMIILLVVVSLISYNYKLCTNREATIPIVAAFTLTLTLVAALTAYDYKLHTNQEASRPRLAASICVVALVVIWIVVAYVTLNLTCTNHVQIGKQVDKPKGM